MTARTLTAMLVTVLAATNLAAQYKIVHGEKRYADFEICFYKYDVDNPYSGFEGDHTECGPFTSDMRTTIAPAAYLLRRNQELISALHPVFMPDQYSKDPHPKVPAIDFTVTTTATIDLSAHKLKSGEHWSLILIDQPGVRLTVMPLGSQKNLVPANTRMIVAAVRDNRPYALSDVIDLRTRDEYTLRVVNESGVLFRFRVNGGYANRDFLYRIAPKLQVPLVTLTDYRGNLHGPAWIASHGGMMNGEMYLFPRVPPGLATLECSGSGWKTLKKTVHVNDGVTVIEEPIELEPQ